jgi:hypothetical protein
LRVTDDNGTSNPNDDLISAASNPFVVKPANPGTVTFTPQPTLTQVWTSAVPKVITPAVTVAVHDLYGNPSDGVTVAMALNPPTTGGASSFRTPPSTPTITNAAGGIATFVLAVDTVAPNYKMTATATQPGVPVSVAKSAQSAPFTIATTVNTCNGNSCNANAKDTADTLTLTATGTFSNTTLGIALYGANNITIPAGVCNYPGYTFSQAPSTTGAVIETTATVSRFDVTWTLAKKFVKTTADNGAAKYNICLGALHLLDKSNTAQGFPKLGGNFATPVPEPNLGPNIYLYWGLLPDCPRTIVATTGPCIVSRTKTTGGDMVVKFIAQYPWDLIPHLGP